MQDRTPTYPGRVKLTPVTGQTNIYDMEMADQPGQAGTALNKANLLTDATAAAIAALSGTTPDTPNEALAELANSFGGALMFEKKEYTGAGSASKTVTFSAVQDFVFVYRTGSGAGSVVYLISPFYKESANPALAWNFTNNSDYQLTYSWTGNAITWTGSAADTGFNYSGVDYTAIGVKLGA